MHCTAEFLIDDSSVFSVSSSYFIFMSRLTNLKGFYTILKWIHAVCILTFGKDRPKTDIKFLSPTADPHNLFCSFFSFLYIQHFSLKWFIPTRWDIVIFWILAGKLLSQSNLPVFWWHWIEVCVCNWIMKQTEISVDLHVRLYKMNK